MARHHFAGRIDAHVAAAPSAHARLGLAREIVVLHECDFERAAILRYRLARDFLGAIVLLARRHQRAAILRRPRIELRIRQLEAIRSEIQCERDEFGHLGNIQPMNHDVERQRKADLADEPRDVEFFSMRAHAGDRLGAFARGTLDAQLNMVEARLATAPQLVLVEQRAACDQVGVEIIRSRVLNQFDQIVAKDRLAARQMQLHDAQFRGLAKKRGAIRRSRVRRASGGSRRGWNSTRIAAGIDRLARRRACMVAAPRSLEQSARANRVEEVHHLARQRVAIGVAIFFDN